jgi:hypothetical protein
MDDLPPPLSSLDEAGVEEIMQHRARLAPTEHCWSARFVRSVCLQLEVAKEVLHQLEMARAHRSLAVHEDQL